MPCTTNTYQLGQGLSQQSCQERKTNSELKLARIKLFRKRKTKYPFLMKNKSRGFFREGKNKNWFNVQQSKILLREKKGKKKKCTSVAKKEKKEILSVQSWSLSFSLSLFQSFHFWHCY